MWERNSDFGVTGNFSSVLELGINDPVGGRLRGEHVCAPEPDSDHTLLPLYVGVFSS